MGAECVVIVGYYIITTKGGLEGSGGAVCR